MPGGIYVAVEGDDLVLEASAPPPPAVLDLLSRHKARIVTLLRSADGRAGIDEFDGGLPRAEVGARAFACWVAEWLNRNPVRSPGRCLGCGNGDHAQDPLLPFGSTGHAWLHSRCWSAWYTGRRAEAVGALAAMGIMPPAHLPDDFGKNGARNGRLRIGTAEWLGARQGRSLPLDRHQPAAQDGLPWRRLVRRLAMDARW